MLFLLLLDISYDLGIGTFLQLFFSRILLLSLLFFRLFFVLQPEPELLPKYFVHIREWLGLRQIDLLQQY